MAPLTPRLTSNQATPPGGGFGGNGCTEACIACPRLESAPMCRLLPPCRCSAVVGVIAALASHSSAAALTAVHRQSSDSVEGDGLLYQTYATFLTGAYILTKAIRESGQLAQLSDADALRFGSAASLAVRGMPGVCLFGCFSG